MRLFMPGAVLLGTMYLMSPEFSINEAVVSYA